MSVFLNYFFYLGCSDMKEDLSQTEELTVGPAQLRHEADAEDSSGQREQGAGEGIYATAAKGGPGEEAGGAEGGDGTDQQAGISGEDT